MTATAFTIGRTASYDAAIAKDPNDVWKAEGGWIFMEKADAEAFLERNQGKEFEGFTLDESFSVYGLELTEDWFEYVGENPPNPERANFLIKPAKIIKL